MRELGYGERGIVTGSLLNNNDHPIVISIDYQVCYYNATLHNNEYANHHVQ
jgi:hypothetical protein